MRRLALLFVAPVTFYFGWAQAQLAGSTPENLPATTGLRPNLAGHLDTPLRYKPDHGDFVIDNGHEFFNRSLYGGNTAFRVDGGDKPEFLLYLPGRGGNLRLGVRVGRTLKWLNDAAEVETRYRPGELLYRVRDPEFAGGEIDLEVLAYAETEGLIVRAQAAGIPGASLVWAFGGASGERGARSGDIGTEKVPISEFFQLLPNQTAGNTFALTPLGFTLHSKVATIAGTVPAGAQQAVARAENWDNLPALLSPGSGPAERQIVVGTASFGTEPLLLSLQRLEDGAAPLPESKVYTEAGGTVAGPTKLLPLFAAQELPARFAAAQRHFDALRNRVRIDTPDPYLDAAMGALNIVSDALWDSSAKAIMHGSIAWRTKLLGWRGPYVLDELGWHERARENFETWLPKQNVSPIPAYLPTADPKANLARNEPGLHSNGDFSHSHYDMNAVFMDALFRSFMWTGDKAFALEAWPAIKRHLAWEQRLFRREYGKEKLPLYEAYASIWASDDLYYNGGGTAYQSAYNVYANRMAARIAVLAGDDPQPYTTEADAIERGMRSLLWLPSEGTYAEYKDVLGLQLVHPSYGLWTFYHTIDEQATTPKEAWQMGAEQVSHLRPIPVTGPDVPHDRAYHVLSESNWMPYSWSINNVVMEENLHTALALWEGGHSEDAYTLAKGALLASMYMGISPGNVGTLDYLDVYRRESQRDFGDGAGVLSRTIVEGLFGVHPDALTGRLLLAPGFPAEWDHATLTHPDLGVAFKREDLADTYTVTQPGTRFTRLSLRVPTQYDQVERVEINGLPTPWRSDPDAVGRPVLALDTALGPSTQIRIVWKGIRIISPSGSPSAGGIFAERRQGAFTWAYLERAPEQGTRPAYTATDWQTPHDPAKLEVVDLSAALNDRVTNLFAPGKYVSPRSNGVSLALPSQGAGAWAGHLKSMPLLDDTGMRRRAAAHGNRVTMPNGIPFATPSTVTAKNIAFTSQWDAYPHEAQVAIDGRATHLYLLMAGTTNFMQSRFDNGEAIVAYTDGTTARLPLRNPGTWWPIEQDYFIDDYQFPLEGELPPRIDLKTGKIRVLDPRTFKGQGGEVVGGAATVLHLPLDPAKQLRSLTVRTLANDVVIGLMSATLERP